MLASSSPRKAHFRYSPTLSVALALSTPCSRSDSSYWSRCGFHTLALPHNLVIFTDSPFPFRKGGFGVFANCSLCGAEAILSYWPGLACSSFLLKPAPYCKLLSGLGSTNKTATSVSPVLSDSCSVLATLSFLSILHSVDIKNYKYQISETIFSLLLVCSEVIVAPWSLISFRKRHGQ